MPYRGSTTYVSAAEGESAWGHCAQVERLGLPPARCSHLFGSQSGVEACDPALLQLSGRR